MGSIGGVAEIVTVSGQSPLVDVSFNDVLPIRTGSERVMLPERCEEAQR